MEKVIIHSDLNAFYASVEMLLEPSLRGKAVAVCGSAENRHGIVLAKSEKAKKAGVKTGMANWQARKVCPGLIIVPPQYNEYVKYSDIVRNIYRRYTNMIEPFGMDECWCDLTGCAACPRDSLEAAEEIRRTVYEETGLTVSVGVSFSKVFAKLGSDMKKPNATTLISKENFKQTVWPLPVSNLLYVGSATTRKLTAYNIKTIGELAAAGEPFLRELCGVNGTLLWRFASGLDDARVCPDGYAPPAQSVGHGITCSEDLSCEEQVWLIILALAQDVGHRLRKYGCMAQSVQLHVRDNSLRGKQYQMRLAAPTQSPMEIAKAARALFDENHKWTSKVRAVTVRAAQLISASQPYQLTLFDDDKKRRKRESLEKAVDDIRSKYGIHSICNACLLADLKMPNDGRQLVTLPDKLYM